MKIGIVPFILYFFLDLSLEQDGLICDMSNDMLRLSSCPDGFCCARDQFLASYVYCKRLGTLNHQCTTIASQAHCPCGPGLHCVPNVVRDSYTSVYGTCQNFSIKASTIPPSTTVITETMASGSTITSPTTVKSRTDSTKTATVIHDSTEKSTMEHQKSPTTVPGLTTENPTKQAVTSQND